MNQFAPFFRPVPITHQRFKACRDGVHGYLITTYPEDPWFVRVEVKRLDETKLGELGT